MSLSENWKKEEKNTIDEKQRRKNINSFMFAVYMLFFAIMIFVGYNVIKGGKIGGASRNVYISIEGREVFSGKISVGIKNIEIESGYADKDVVEVFPDRIRVKTGNGVNILEPGNNAQGQLGIKCTEADCPDRVCVDTGLITYETQSIVCLPHKMVVRIGY